MRLAWFLLVVTILAACGGGEEGDDAAPPPTQRPEPTTAPSVPDQSADTTPSGSVPDHLDDEARRIVEAAVSDLADRTGAPAGEIRLVSFEYVTWRDGSLGCPQPGEMYTQALVDGSRTVLEVGGDTFAYHAGNNGDPFLCEDPAPGSGTVPSREK